MRNLVRRKIRTEHFDVIFPHGIEADAQRAANSLETLYVPMSQSLGFGGKRIQPFAAFNW